jgi:serine/threonine protein kinase
MADLSNIVDDPRKDPNAIFDLVERLGEGSYGAVWKGRHKETSDLVAIKIIPVENDLADLLKEIK